MKSSVSRRIGKYENEASLRLHRSAVDASRKLDQQLAIVSSLNDLFSSSITDLRMRLKDYYERLIFTDPVEYGKKVEELLWRKVYYDFFHRCKQNRKKLAESDYYRNSLISHLLAGIGFYHHMLLRIQTEFHIELEGKVDAPFLWHLKGVKKERWKKYQRSAANDENVKSWAIQACHRILIYLGDLERYISEFNAAESHHLSERYYLQAFCLNSQNGIPHNQLGSLYSNRFDSAYHYMRCLSCIEKSELAEVNLKREFEKNDEVMDQLYSPNNNDNESLRCAKLLSKFLKLCQIFYFFPGENSQKYCQDILLDFDKSLNSSYFYEDFSVKDTIYPVLTDDIVFKIVVMALICVDKLLQKNHSDLSIATAFCLALFSHIVNGTTSRLLQSLYELRSEEFEKKNNYCENNSKHEMLSLKEKLSDTSVESVNKDFVPKKLNNKRNGLKKLSSKHLRSLRRRRKMSSTSQEDSELSEGEMTDLPESDEENILLNSDVSETGSISSESLSENEDELLTEQNNVNNEEMLKKDTDIETNYNDCLLTHEVMNGIESKELKKSEKNVIPVDKKFLDANFNKSPPSITAQRLDIQCQNIQQLQQFPLLNFWLFDDFAVSSEKIIEVLQKNGLLMSLKILSDWIKINEDVLSACVESSQVLLSRVIELLNLLLKIEEKLLSGKVDDFSKLQCMDESWKQTYPLPEDTALHGFPPVSGVHSHLQFDVSMRRELSSSLQAFLRVQCLLSFGKHFTKVSESSVDFDLEKKRYYFNLCNKIKESNKDEFSRITEKNYTAEKQKHNLMKSMAHLWLKAEVNDLELLVEGGAAPQLSPYLVTDTSVLCYNLTSLRQLIASRRFIVIVPLVVIANLDQLKKESLGAREAIRWLENELRKGCRFIRAQRQMEKISLVPMKYPRKKEKEAWDFFQILECCNYLVQQQTNGKTKCSLVTLLVGPHNNLPENAAAIAQSIDVTIENLGIFFSKWKNSTKNPG